MEEEEEEEEKGGRGRSRLNNTTAVVREEYEGAVQAILSPATHHQTDKWNSV